jgi:hypothetical protein
VAGRSRQSSRPRPSTVAVHDDRRVEAAH